jgi:hypothetical protein
MVYLIRIELGLLKELLVEREESVLFMDCVVF